jgi:hypothetical protein
MTKNILLYEEYGERMIIFDCLFLLFDLWSHLVSINRNANLYLPLLRQDANIQFAVV